MTADGGLGVGAGGGARVGGVTSCWDGHLQESATGGFVTAFGGQWVPFQVPASQAGELRALLGLRDLTLALLAEEASTGSDTPRLGALRGQLNAAYEAYTASWGPINRASYRRTGRVDPDTGAERYALVRPRQGGFRHDPAATNVLALEHYDPAAGTAIKADIFSRRVIAPRAPVTHVSTARDAVTVCVEVHGRVDLDHIATLLSIPVEQAREAVAGLVYPDPGRPEVLIPAAAYLSGNVRTKLAEATQAEAEARAGVDWTSNVAALREVVPADIPPAQIEARSPKC